ncbi:MAG: NAD(P)/FAD-dependent oxidoreductase [Clostridiales bacterium]|nr:NAD(P)/FAD-dependent oxidoreductase [Clostridiales bacterium]
MMKVAVIGAGASGLMAAYAAAVNGNDVTVFEKNEKSGKKIYITGKGRCNITNAVSAQEFLLSVVSNAKFLSGAIYSFPPEETVNFFESQGLRLKTERGNRVFPASDKASDVTKYLEKACISTSVKFNFNKKVDNLTVLNSTVSGIIVNNNKIPFDKVIVCTGGMSYPLTGSTGDGYRFAENCGHKIISLKPALCGLNLKGNYFSALSGLSLKNVRLSIFYGDKLFKSLFGEMLFTHFGVSGPIMLTASSLINRLDLNKVRLSLDLKPALTEEQLDERVLRDFSKSPNKNLAVVLKELLPSSLIGEVLKRATLRGDKKVNSVSKAERQSLLTTVKSFDMLVTSLRSFDEAIVTSGGVDVKEVNPKTMESKLVKGLYFCGEVLDVDAFTGGFNLQIAFSTGFAAGNSIKAEEL